MATSQFPTTGEQPDLNKLLQEIAQGVMVAGATVPEVVQLATSMVMILQSGTVTPAQEQEIRAQLDATRQQIDQT